VQSAQPLPQLLPHPGVEGAERLVELQRTSGLSYLFISHDLGVISHLSDHVLVMKDGVAVEEGTPDQIFGSPQHPYTRQLIASIPEFDPSSLSD